MRYPKILGLRIDATTFLVPEDVIHEINHRAEARGVSSDKRIDLIDRASKDRTIEIVNASDPIYQNYYKSIESSQLSDTDKYILSIALSLQTEGKSVHIATQDKHLARIASFRGIDVFSQVDIEKLLKNFSEPSLEGQTLQHDIREYENSEQMSILLGVLVGLVGSLILYLIYENFPEIAKTIQITGIMFGVLLIGLLLFIVRERAGLTYGSFEISVGLGSIFLLFHQAGFSYVTMKIDLDFYLKILAGLYIIVRGQDNIVKSLRDKKLGIILKQRFSIG